ncbi:MAG: FecR domain-containing protein [Chryseolinea sp.]
MDKERFLLLLTRYFAEEATAEEEVEMRQMMTQYPELKQSHDVMLPYWKRETSEKSSDQSFENLMRKIQQDSPEEAPQPVKKSRKFGFGMLSIAASIVVVVGFFYLATDSSILSRFSNAEKRNKKGERSMITLSDGSKVWLNADSKLSYPKEFEGQNREVSLDGEAFFDVAKDARHPFVIHLSQSDVRVLGTSFNIKAYHDDETVETSVVTGLVAFIADDADKSVRDTTFLKPNQKAIFQKYKKTVEKLESPASEDKAWTQGSLVFKATPFKQVAKVLSRAYGKEIIFENKDILNCRLTGTFNESSLNEVMELIAGTQDFDYTITDKFLKINGTGCSSHE